ncbi:hypothetical protein CLOM_g1329 [Closterium sp. NIES-68]|nr:hypothetical protein CLOM_g1329 [Closterium sp. NIES-68]GJP72156.1 hypothetical protein CLOP_g2911 [Closterium sp. NIES-67]
MAGSPKRRRFSTRQRAVMRVGYLAMLAFCAFAVRRAVHIPQDPSVSDFVSEHTSSKWAAAARAQAAAARGKGSGGGPHKLAAALAAAAAEGVDEQVLQRQMRWSERPTSLCFGHGNLTLLTVALDLPQDYVVLMRRNRLLYCARHACRYCEVSVSLDFVRPHAWSKVRAMLLVLSFAETVVHIDADALILNHTLSFHSLLDLPPPYNTSASDIVYTMAYRYGRYAEPRDDSHVNTGVYVVHSTPWAKSFLEAQYQFYHSSIRPEFWDHDAIDLYRLKHAHDFHAHVSIIPYRYMSVPCSHTQNEYTPGDFIVHYAGGHNIGKYERLSKLFLE